MLTAIQRSYLRSLFLLKIHKSDGAAFQDFFVELMKKSNPEFRTVKPQGSKGDGGNDGFIASEGLFYQIYAPEEPQYKVTQAVQKAEADFEKLVTKWKPTFEIRRYHFVFNDKEKGAYPDIETALKTIQKNHALEEASPFYSQHLERAFWELTDQEKFDLLGIISVPEPDDLEGFEFVELSDLLRHLMESPSLSLPSSLGKVPDFSNKIQFNGLSDYVGQLLQFGSFQQGFIEDYFERVPNDFTRKDVRDRLRAIYLQEKQDLEVAPLTEASSQGDLVFFALMKQISPQEKMAIDAAVVSLISYYFEKCDVFEDPSA